MTLFLELAPIAGLFFFFVLYLGILLNTYRPSKKTAIQAHAFIPLKEEPNHE